MINKSFLARDGKCELRERRHCRPEQPMEERERGRSKIYIFTEYLARIIRLKHWKRQG